MKAGWVIAAAVAAGFAAATFACGAYEEENAAPSSDAAAPDVVSASDSSILADGPADAGFACRTEDPFGTATELAGVNDGANTVAHPRLTPDELEIFYEREFRVFRATRASAVLAFGNGAAVPPIDASALSLDPSISIDSLVLYVALDSRIARLARPSRTASFGAPAVIELYAGDAGEHDQDPQVLGDDRVLYFTRYQPGNAAPKIWRTERDGSGTFAPPAAVDLGGDSFNNAWVSEDELQIYVTHAATGTMRRAIRTSRNMPFPTPTSVEEINAQFPTAPNTRAGWISPDGCRLYFVAVAAPRTVVYVAERKPR